MIARFIGLIAPPYCALCRQLCAADSPGACDACIADLPWSSSRQVTLNQLNIDVVAPLDYTFPIDAAIRAWKYQRRQYYSPLFSAVIQDAIPDLPESIDAIVAVPLHWRRYAIRGFNQADILANAIHRQTGVPLIHKVHRIRATAAQSALAATRRRGNLKGAFVCRGSIDAQHVLLVDDVVTTGETLHTVAAALKAAGVGRVSAVTLAQTRVV